MSGRQKIIWKNSGSEVQEYEQFSRRRFFEQVVTGQLSVGEIYEKAGTLGIAIEAQCYNLILYSVQGRSDLSGFSGENADPAVQIRDALERGFFSGAPEYLMFRWNLMTYAVLLKGEREKMDTLLGSTALIRSGHRPSRMRGR